MKRFIVTAKKSGLQLLVKAKSEPKLKKRLGDIQALVNIREQK